MKKFLTVVGLLAVLATPAFAQSFNPGYGTGNELPFSYQPTAQGTQSIAHANGSHAFAMAPRAETRVDRFSPALNGGGSEGYNANIYND
jgi:hypothetical protein